MIVKMKCAALLSQVRSLSTLGLQKPSITWCVRACSHVGSERCGRLPVRLFDNIEIVVQPYFWVGGCPTKSSLRTVNSILLHSGQER